MELDSLQKLFDTKYKDRQEIEISGECHDCKKNMTVKIRLCDDGFLIEGGAVYEPDPEKYFLKCDECYAKNPVLTNFQQCQIFSRVVGYLTPVNQWNEGKKAEFEQRKTFDIQRALDGPTKN
jgi:ribonucleoside-triphosphate reductase